MNKQRGIAALPLFIILAIAAVVIGLYWSDRDRIEDSRRSLPLVRVLYPVGAEAFKVGETVSIRWSAPSFSSDAPVEIELQGLSGCVGPNSYCPDIDRGPKSIIKYGNITNTGIYEWEITWAMGGGAIIVCVQDTYGAGHCGQSERISVISP